MSKKYLEGNELARKNLSGVKKLADYVGSTLGPKGNNVILHVDGKSPIVTKDGVTIAKFMDLEDPFENASLQILKQVAAQTNEEAGDGTTTSTVLAAQLYKTALTYLEKGSSGALIKKGMDKACQDALEILAKNSRPIESMEQIEQIATISANGDESIGKMISMAIDKVGRDGAISIEEARSVDTTLDLIEGFIFDSGYVSPRFITNERKKSVNYDDCLILITDHTLSNLDTVFPILELAARNNKPLLIVAEEIEGQVLSALIMNAVRGTMKVAAVKAPRYGEERREILKDLSVATGGTFFSRDSNRTFADFKLDDFGRASKIEVKQRTTTILSGYTDVDRLEERIETIKTHIKDTDNLQEAARLQERLNRLASGIAVIRVGGSTEVEMIEKKHRIEDALEAVRSAQAAGIHSGGGMGLVRASFEMMTRSLPDTATDDERNGYKAVVIALTAPFRKLAHNAGLSPEVKLAEVKDLKEGMGCNFINGEIIDLYEAGVIDPVKVTSCALRNAVSAASTLMTTNHAIIEVK